MTIHSYEHDGETFTVSLEPHADGSYTAMIDDRGYTVRAQQSNDGAWLLTLDDARVVAYGAIHDSDRHVHLDGQTYTLTVPDTQSRRRRQAARSGALEAQMPGQVTDVLVQAGDPVERGQTLITLEAMKMEIRVAAPAAGVVKAVLVKSGDVVERGQTLIEITQQ
jgi:biotin carboxyl carrier protein